MMAQHCAPQVYQRSNEILNADIISEMLKDEIRN
jgi:hypothetical protein